MSVGVAECARHAVEDLGGQLREQPLCLDGSERARVLGEEDVGGRVVALLGDRRGELGAVAVADLDVDAGLLLEPLEQRCDELLLAARVDRQLAVTAASAAPARGRTDRENGADERESITLRIASS